MIGSLFCVFAPQVVGQQQQAKSKAIIINCHDCKIISLPKPEYPKIADAVNATGKVSVQVLIDEKGNVVEAKAITRHLFLRGEAEGAAYKAKFEPKTLSGKPVKMRSVIVYNFASDSPVQKKEENSQPKNQEKIARGGIVNGKASYLPKPGFTEEAKRFCASGKVEVEVLIDEKGDVPSAKAISGDKLLQESAVNAARKAKFRQIADGVPVKTRGVVIYNFIPEEKCIDVGIVNKKARFIPKPEFPKSCRCSGQVVVQVIIDILSGKVIQARAISGHPLLRIAAVDSAKQAVFAPTLININRLIYAKGLLFITFR